MNNTLEDIQNKIKNGTIKFHNSNNILEEYIATDINELIYIIIHDYIHDLTNDLATHTIDFYFRTQSSDLCLVELLDKNIKSTGFYFDINAPEESRIYVEIDFPEYDNKTDFEEYINKLLEIIDNETIERCLAFNVDEQFNELWDNISYCTAREFINMLEEDKKFFTIIANSAQRYRNE